jgi:proline iminopeptidase
MSARGAVAALSGLAGIYALVVRPRLLRSGATDEEVRSEYPGAELIPVGKRGATMAVTIDAPPSAVWPWLVQMGCDQAGWYSWDRLDNAGVPSADRIHPEWQDVSVGDRMLSTPSGVTWFEVAALEQERFLALRAPIDLHRGRPFDTKGLRPRLYNDSVWCFLLNELSGGRTRLVVSGYAAQKPASASSGHRLPVLGACSLDHAAAAVREPEAARGANHGHFGDRCGRAAPWGHAAIGCHLPHGRSVAHTPASRQASS